MSELRSVPLKVRVHTVVWLAMTGLAALVISGCGLTANQRTSITKFSNATATLGELARKEFVQSRADVIEMNSLALNLGSTKVDPDQLDEFFTAERVELRTAACDAIKTYGELLQTLATTDNSAELKVAADSFVTSLKGLKSLDLEDTQAGAIGSAIEFIGSGIIEAYRRERVVQIVKHSSPAVRATVDLLKNDFDLDADHWQLGYDATVSRMKDAAKKRTPAVGLGGVGTAEAAVIRSATTTSAKNVARRDEAVAKIAEAAGELELAEKDLLRVVAYPEISTEDIDKFFESVVKLDSLIKVLSNK